MTRKVTTSTAKSRAGIERRILIGEVRITGPVCLAAGFAEDFFFEVSDAGDEPVAADEG
jgi:hypothetical protein